MNRLLEIRQLDAVIKKLDELRDAIPRASVSPRVKTKAVVSVIDQLDDLRELLIMPRVGRPITCRPSQGNVCGSTEWLLLKILAVAALATVSIQAGIHHGRTSCPAPNVARVGP
jgi:hypothetical protein